MSSPKYRPDIDGLRAVAVLAVLVNHITPDMMPGGYVGVDVFFVISGYLITKILRAEVGDGSFTFARFYERRLLRLFPALFATLAFVLVAGWFLALPRDYASTMRVALGSLTFSSNVVLWREMAAGYFAADARLNPLLHTWSLSVEEQFYVGYPIVLLLLRRLRENHLLGVLVTGAAVTLIAAEVLVRGHPVAVFFLAPFRAWELIAGGVLTFAAVPPMRARWARELAGLVGLAMIGGSATLLDEASTFPGISALPSVLGAALLIHVGSSGESATTKLLAMRPLVYVGLISYSLYLWHWPIVVLARFASGMAPTPSMAIPLYAASLVAGALSHRLIERPFRSRPPARRATFMAAFAATAIAAAACAAGVWTSGFDHRASEEVRALDALRAPDIPFRSCDGTSLRNPSDWCVVGSTSAPPTVLAMGDSHMLAWGPALDAALSDLDRSAYFLPNSACPPIFDASVRIDHDCASANAAIRRHLEANPNAYTVVLASRWHAYFEDNVVESTTSPAEGASTAGRALRGTIAWLMGHEISFVLVGPVPEYDRDVPLSIALARRDGVTPQLETTLEETRATNQEFYEIAAELDPSSFVAPATWICTPDCVYSADGLPLYRDSHHLNVAGAMSFRRQWVELLRNHGALETVPLPL